jgi:hypothetical protein
MKSGHFHALARSLAAPGTRRGALAASVAGTFGLLTRAEAEAGRGKKKRRKKQRCNRPYCHGKDCSLDPLCHRPGSAVNCFCRHDPFTGAPRCVQGGRLADECTDCVGDELCVACGGALECHSPCPDPR